MRKIFFLSALVISAMSMAQSSAVNWHDVSAVDNQGIKNGLNFVGYSSYEAVQVNEAGDLFVSANINSVGRDPHATIFEASVEAVPGKVNLANAVPAPMFVKANSAGDVQWIVAATDANYKSFATLPTSDGGLLVALVGHQAIVDVLGMGLHNGAAADKVVHQLAKEQYGLLVKIASDGKPSILATIKQAAEGKTDGIQVRKIVTDGTYYYVLANLKSKVAIGTVEVEPAHENQARSQNLTGIIDHHHGSPGSITGCLHVCHIALSIGSQLRGKYQILVVQVEMHAGVVYQSCLMDVDVETSSLTVYVNCISLHL